MDQVNTTRRLNLKVFLKKYALLLSFLVIVLVITFSSDVFLTLGNLTDIVRQSSINGLVAVGMTFVILSGCIDLSAAAIVALAGSIRLRR
jgi:putative xylitol transport system permease protein